MGVQQQGGQTIFTFGLLLPDPLYLIGIPFGLWSSLYVLGVSHSLYPCLGFVNFPQISSRFTNIINVPRLDSAWISQPIPGSGDGKYLGFHSCRERGPIRAFHTAVQMAYFIPNSLRICCTSSIEFLYLPRRCPILRQASLQAGLIQSVRKWAPWTPPHPQVPRTM